MSHISAGRTRYLTSLSAELKAQSQRVRDLIGTKHWLSDGYHKEDLLRGVLRRHSPSAVTWTRGFVISPTDAESCSREQDILAVDSTYEAPIFSQGDMVIAFPRNVLAAISVKTTMRHDTVQQAIEGLNSVRSVANRAGADPRLLWCGAYFYEKPAGTAPEAVYRWITQGIQSFPVQLPLIDDTPSPPAGPDIISVADDEVFRLDYGPPASAPLRLRGFNCHSLATGIFMINLLDHVTARRGRPAADLLLFADEPGVVPLAPAEVRFGPV
jgi:hypothetical protein